MSEIKFSLELEILYFGNLAMLFKAGYHLIENTVVESIYHPNTFLATSTQSLPLGPHLLLNTTDL